ncbi:MAG: hypothetical protein KBC12_02485 [Candidatus Pacebacteria bacterium]|nr:hypothetical protein [Candidatus Paceibacterota bacterium]
MPGLEQVNMTSVKSEIGPDGLPGLIEINPELSKDGALRAVFKKKDGTWLLLVTIPAHGKWVPFVPVTVKSNAEGKLDPGKRITPEQALEFYKYSKDPKNINLPTWAVSE